MVTEGHFAEAEKMDREALEISRRVGCIEQKDWQCGGSSGSAFRVAVASHLVRSNQEWALDFACDTLATGRGIRVLAVVDAFR